MKAPPAKSPAERMKHTAGAAARGGGDAPPSLGLVPSAAPPPPSSSPSDSLPRFAAIAAHNTTPPLSLAFASLSSCVLFAQPRRPRVYTRATAQDRVSDTVKWVPPVRTIWWAGQLYEPNQAGE